MRLYLQMRPQWHRVIAYAFLIMGVVLLGLKFLEWLFGAAVDRGSLTVPTIILVMGALAFLASTPSTTLPEAEHPRK